jgi:capsular polysaccharide biosynthesis protein
MHYLNASEWDHMSLFISRRVLGHVPSRNPGMVWIANRDEGSSREWLGSGDVSIILQGLGYNVSTERPGRISFERQVLLVRTASFIVGPHGSSHDTD